MTNPFSEALRDPNAPENPFRDALRLGGSFGDPFGEEERLIPEFFKGIKTGFLTPLRVFGVGEEEEIGSDHPIAKMLGEFGGIAVSFIPLFKATQIAIRGVGLTSRLAPMAVRALEGATAFGLFEAGAAEEFADVPVQFAKGAAIGAGAELAFIGAARAFRGALRNPPGARVNPDGIRVENAVVPNNAATPEEALRRIELLRGKDPNPTHAAATLISEGSLAGIGLIPAITNPKAFASYMRTSVPGVSFSLRETGEGTFEALLWRDLTRKQTQQFASRGGYTGMEVIHNGVPKELVSQPSPGRILVRDKTSGIVQSVETQDIQKAVQMEEVISGRAFINSIEDPEVKSILEGAIKAASAVSDDLVTYAERSGLKLLRSTDERYLLRTPSNLSVAEFGTEAEVLEFLSKWGVGSRRNILAEGGVSEAGLPAEGAALGSGGVGGPPPKFQAVTLGLPDPAEPGVLQRMFDAVSIGAPWLTAMENFAKAIERQGFGPAFSKVFQPLQLAVARVDRDMGLVLRELLQGKTFNNQIRVIQKLSKDIPKSRHSDIRGLVEAMSREEIANTRGLVEGVAKPMTPTEMRIGRVIERVGLKDDVPRLLSTMRFAQALQRSKKAFRKRVNRLDRQQLAPETEELIANLERVAREEVPDSFEGILDALGMTKEEKFVISMLSKANRLPKDEFSSYVVSRWLVAPSLKKGFVNGRAQWIAEHNITAHEQQLVKELDRLLNAAFTESGLSARRQIAGYWSHMRMWIEQGLGPSDEFMQSMLPKKSIEWTSARFRGGELNVYETDPVLMAVKYTRGLLMKRHFDPVLPTTVDALRAIEGRSPRLFKIMTEYVNQLKGLPHVTFRKLNSAIAETMKVLKVGDVRADRLAEKVINSMTAVGYAASIPFRPALILRNYWQMVQMIPPRIGFRHFFNGLERALTKEGFEDAVKRGIIPVDVLPVMAATEIAATFQRTLGPLQFHYKELFDLGFRWYRKADDIGRAVAYHGMQARIKEHLPAYMSGKIKWERFLQKSKVNTFDSNDIAEFTRLFRDGQIEEAGRYLGSQLSREAHFRYGHANHPAGWGSVYGRLFGQFGTWPVQYKDHLVGGLTRGSLSDKIEFAAIHAATNLSLAAAGAAVGVNLWSWIAFPSLQYTGGPYADAALDLVKAVSGSDAEQAMARRGLRFLFPSLDDPRSIFIPGSYLIGDLSNAFKEDRDPALTRVFKAGGFKFLEPGDDSGLEWLFEAF